ncbi:hypothetical protein ABZ960_35675 [Streptomyces pseudovenezuelae]|uniref:hypothetical protein n=1 Tax=Streptomyces pseudovenezuelae TaxID=67350 RepID=UPI0034A19C8F
MNAAYAPQGAPYVIPGAGIVARNDGLHDEDMADRFDVLQGRPAATPEPTAAREVTP